ncbi:MAG: hypothetical protein CMC96_01470 [Flavobacteriales bacterium]|nr:hypothetical protein [Flavobacteriales bacterium]
MARIFVYCILFFTSLILLGTKSLYATHIMGGEITWQCQANGQYVFTLKVYRDCNGTNLATNGQEIEIHNYPNVGLKDDINVTLINVTDISPDCLGNPCSGSGGVGAIEEYVFESAPVTLNGVPPAVGWTFTWDNFARNGAIDNIINADDFGITLRATMFPYQGRNAFPCFDSSPDFFQEPSTVVCADQAFTYNHSAYDDELDSLVYSWARPLDQFNACGACIYQENTIPQIINYDGTQGYTFNSPFPGPTLDTRNVPATLDANTGEISFESYTAGEFVSVVRVQAYKCGDLVAEVYRDLQTVIQSGCGLNKAPEIPPVFANGTFSDTVKAGELVNFDINIYDTLRTGNSSTDSIFIYATGQQFGTNYTSSTTGCTNPPCATFSQALPDASFGTYNTTFNWQTSCDHIAQSDPYCTSSQSTYLFVLRAYDNFCPAAGLNVATISITVLADTLMDHPDIHCADVQANGDVIIDWNQTADPDSSFQQWMIYSSTNRGGPYTLIDSILDYNITTYTHNNAGANDQSIHYIVRAKSGCHQDWLSLPTDTISSMYINPTFNGNCVDVSWNTLDNPLPDGSATNYEVYREFPVGSGFSLLKTTADTFFCDTFDVCTDTVTYRIQIANSGNGCWGSSSNINGVRFQYAQPSVNATVDFDASCFGINDGIAYATPSGGTAPYTYLWSDNQTQDTARNLSAGTYQLTLTDSKGCIDTTSVTITEPDSLISSIGSSIDVSCFGGNDAYAVANGVGGTSPYTYLWSDNQVQDTAKNLSARQYRVTITDALGCSDTVSVEINEPPLLTAVIIDSTNISCKDGNDGTATATALGGTSPYTYSWSNGQSGITATNLLPNTYFVMVTDANNCSAVAIVSLEEPDSLLASTATVNNVSCNGGSDGSAVVTPSGGRTPYTYLWDNNQTTDTVTNLAAGNHSVTITDSSGCTFVSSINITEPATLTVSTNVDFDASCFGLSDGTAYATPSGGTAPYTYLWSDNQAQDTARNLGAGSYQLTVTDQNGCTATSSVSITEPDSLISSIGASIDVSCHGGNDAYAVANGVGGTTPYTYLWSDNQVQDTAKNLSAGQYRVTITDAQGCFDTVSVEINEPTPLQTSISSSANVSCNGLSDGSATVSANGGTSPYTYLWSDNQTTANAASLSAGNHSVTVTDANACTSVESITLTEPNVLSSTLATQIDVSCNGFSDGSAKVTMSGGTTPYTYLWSDNQTADSAINLSAGSYTVTITDANGCTENANVTISEPAILTTSAQLINHLNCYQANDGAAYATANGGTTPYTYNWSNNTANDSISSIAAGTYVVTVTDAQNCTATDTVQITQPDSLQSSITDTVFVSCNSGNDGSAEVTALGGTTPYTYTWSDNQTTQTAGNLSQGTYQVTVSDANGCTTISTVTITEPPLLTASISATTNVSCNGLSNGRAVVTANGGTLPYTYLWNDNQQTDTASNLSAGSYSVTVTDNKGCTATANITISEPAQLTVSNASSTDVSCNGGNDGQATVNINGGTTPYTYLWSDNQTTATANNLTEGTYTVTVTDDLGCTISDTIIINEPTVLTSTISSTSNISCNGAADGSATVSATGGTQPYTYNWSNNATTANIQNLNPGTYIVTITDANSCTKVDSVSISQPNALTSSISNSTNVSCFGLADGTAAVTLSGGTTPYTYFWSTNATTSSIQNLGAGTYRVTVTDNNNCRITDSVTITQPNQLTSSLSGQDISCFGRNDGTISASVNGGTAPYSYNWSNNSSNSTIGNLAAGTYTVTITDINSCEVTNSFQINEPDDLTLSVTADDTVCINVPKQLVAVAQGGTGAYTYSWSNNLGNSPNQSVTPQQNTTYSVSVTDANNCPQKVESVSLTVRDIASNNLSVNSSNNVCVGDSATISVSFDGNLEPYFYNWNQALNGISDQRVSPPSTTTYRLTITDICNNSINDSAVVQVSEPPQINLNDTLVQGCEDLSVSFSNRTPNGYTYEWIFGNGESSTEAEPTHIYTEPGLYNVGLKVTTPQGCESISDANYQVRVLNAPEAEIFANPTSADIKNPIIDFYGNFGDAVSWEWFFGDGRDSSNVNNITYTYADTGTYRVKLFETGSNGCIDSAFVNIRINPNYDIKIPNVFIPNTGGSNGGTYNPNNPDNSVFFPYMEYVEDYHLMIFNRWGELVFESKDINIGWDGYYKGKLAQADVYVYKIEVQFINGKRETKVGDLTLLR